MFKAVWAICWKDIKLYYAKGPIVVTGIIFPIFLWMAFYAGKGLELKEGLASLITLTLLFTASSVTPIIAPWETRQRTLEMLLSRPVTVRWVLVGDVLASTIFGMVFVTPIIALGAILNITPANPFLTIVAITFTAVGLSSLGVMFFSYPHRHPSRCCSIIKFSKIATNVCQRNPSTNNSIALMDFTNSIAIANNIPSRLCKNAIPRQ
jgi:ABC-2 type transport system permease protein